MKPLQSEIRELAILGDRRTAALVTATGALVWYCPGRFDQPSLLASLLDGERGGEWRIEPPGARPLGRRYLEDSAVLETRFEHDEGRFSVTDWMPMQDDGPRGICRLVSPVPCGVVMTLRPAPDYARRPAELQTAGDTVCIGGTHWLHASHPLTIDAGAIRLELPAGQEGWAVLADAPLQETLSRDELRRWLDATLRRWRDIAAHITYRGPFERQVAQSLRALRLLTHAPSGGIIAAATTSLPEVPGGTRNYDYRYVWLRDAAMIVSALVRAGSDGPDERKFLDFICGSRQDEPGRPLLPPFLSLDFAPAPGESQLALRGFDDSRPVRIGNGARGQLQLDALANVLLAAKLIYGKYDTREHWDTVRRVADFLAGHWREPDHGIWEEDEPRQYTSSKVIVSCGLRYIAEYAEDAAQAERWMCAVKEIDAYVARHCIGPDGAYVAFAGGSATDVSAALFPSWGYVAADAPEMLATIRALERDHSRGDLYWRHLEEREGAPEGAFLAGTLWVAQYWVLRNELERARRILEAALAHATDLGFFAEEADPASRRMLGNFPQSFVHAAFIGAAVDYRNAWTASRERQADAGD